MRSGWVILSFRNLYFWTLEQARLPHPLSVVGDFPNFEKAMRIFRLPIDAHDYVVLHSNQHLFDVSPIKHYNQKISPQIIERKIK